MTVTSKVTLEELWPFSFNLHVVCNVYVDTSAVVSVTAQSTVGKVALDTNFLPVTFDALNLHSTTGSIQATLSPNTVLKGNISASSTTGSIQFVWSDAKVVGNTSISLASTTGAVSADIGQTSWALGGNVALEARTTTGSVECAVTVGGTVGSQITSHSSTGSISVVNAQNFNGNKSPIYSSNYPAENNFLVDLATTTGSIKVAASYFPSTSTSEQEQVRDAAVNYLRENHPETAQYITSLSWTGGRVSTGLLGAEIYAYQSAGWKVNVSYPVIPNPTYTVVAIYSGVNDSGANVSISWDGTYQGGTVTQTNYGMTLTGTSYVTAASTQEQVRDAVMAYIKANHPETAQIIGDLSWTGGRVDTGLLGAEKYVYETVHGMLGGQWWTVELDYPVIPNPAYTVTANYTQSGVLRPYQAQWEGTWQNNTVAETAYNSNVPSTQEQIRNSVMVYLENNHNEVAQFLGNLNWTGGRATPTGLVGAETYTYLSGGWNVTITYPVIPNPTYRVTADYSAQGISIPYRVIWEGTWQNGAITETSYTFAQ